MYTPHGFRARNVLIVGIVIGVLGMATFQRVAGKVTEIREQTPIVTTAYAVEKGQALMPEAEAPTATPGNSVASQAWWTNTTTLPPGIEYVGMIPPAEAEKYPFAKPWLSIYIGRDMAGTFAEGRYIHFYQPGPHPGTWNEVNRVREWQQ